MENLEDFLPNTLHFAEKVIKFHSIGVLPILAEDISSNIPTLILLEEGLNQEGDIIIREVDGGQVPFLEVDNRSPNRAILLLEGDLLVGGRQNRVLQKSVILLPNTYANRVPVFCSERGRWEQRTTEFSSGGSIFPSRAVFKDASKAESRGVHSSVSQASVWNQIQASLKDVGVHSKTFDFQDARQQVAPIIEQFVNEIRPVNNQIGSVFVDHAGVAGAEMLGNNDLYSRCHDKILESFAFDALSKPPLNGCTPDTVKTWWKDMVGVNVSRQRSLYGVGVDVLMEGTMVAGSGILYANALIHYSCFQLAGRNSNEPHRRVKRSSMKDRRNMLRSSIADN